MPLLHDRVAERYGVPSIRLAPLMRRLPSAVRHHIFRDDCHLHDPGAAFAASAICAALDAMRSTTAASAAASSARHAASALPPPVHLKPWGRGRAVAVTPPQLSFFYTAPPKDEGEKHALQQRLLERHTMVDMDPLDNMQQKAWWLLYARDHAELRFRGTRLGILTMVGPDAGIVSCEVTHVATGQRWTSRQSLLDRWAYFWRLAVVSVAEDLPPGEHVAVLRLETERPARAVLKKPPSGQLWESFRQQGKDHKLWLMHWLIEEESDKERAVLPYDGSGRASARADGAPPRLGGTSVATGGRRADVG